MSNQYAQKLFSEHPIAMWSFDDKVNYISLMTESERLHSAWVAGANTTITQYSGLDKENTPFPESTVFQIDPTNPVSGTSISIYSSSLWSAGDIKTNVPVSASLFIYINTNSIDYVDFGSTSNGITVDVTRNYFPAIAENVWVKVSHSDLLYDKLYLKIYYKTGYSGSDYSYLINGISIGQFSESTSSDSLGITPIVSTGTEDVITSGALPAGSKWYKESSFGIEERNGYHVIKDNELLSYNTAMPIVYGSNYLTKLKPIDAPDEGTHPSFVFDGCGMFTNQGRYDTYTLEFWMRVSGSTHIPRKIVGPAISGNEDGLFICGSTVILSIGSKRASYNLGRLGDPMLFHIVYTPSSLSLLINGELVVEVFIDAKTLTMPDESNQWLGFYSYDDLGPIEIDIVSVFGYAVPGAVAKRRFVWGQGVGEISLINSQYQGDGVFASFSSSNMTNSISYPDTSKWNFGDLNNLNIKRNKIVPADANAPTVFLQSHTKDEWLVDLYTQNIDKDYDSKTVNQLVRFNFCPNSEYLAEQNYALFSEPQKFCRNVEGLSFAIEFNNIGQDNTDLQTVGNFFDSISGTAKNTIIGTSGPWANVDAAWPLLRINNKQNPRTYIVLYAIINTAVVTIKAVYFDLNVNEVTVINSYEVTDLTHVSVIRFAGDSGNSSVTSFFQNLSNIEIVLGSDYNVSSDVNIHSFGFFNTRYYNQTIKTNSLIEPLLNATTGELEWITQLDYDSAVNSEALEIKDLLFTNYTYLPKKEFGTFYEDYGIKGTWEDYIPLATLAGVVKDFEGEDAIALDSIQYNVSYPAPKSIDNPTPPATWTYADLSNYYANLSLGFLYLGVFTGYSTYDDLRDRSSSWDISEMINVVDTSNQFVRTFVSLQPTGSSITQIEQVPNRVSAIQSNSIYFQAFSDYENTLFEVFDGAILIPPRSMKPEQLSLILGIEYAVPGILSFPVEIKSLELASFAKNRNDFTAIKDRAGKDLYPIVTNGTYYDNSAFNPFKVDKKAFPYLYLGNQSGFTPMGPKQSGWKKGLQFLVPEGTDPNFNVDNIQFWIRRDKVFPASEITFLEFEYGNSKIYFTMKSFQDDNKRGIITAYDENGVKYLNGEFFQNGNLVYKPIVDIQQWSAIQFAFADEGLSLNNNVGKITFYPGLSYNNVSYFSTRSAFGLTQINYRSWQDIENQTWLYWKQDNGGYTWEELLIEGTAVLKAQQLSEVVYKTYIGTSFISLDAPQPIRFGQDNVKSYSTTSWSSTSIIPV